MQFHKVALVLLMCLICTGALFSQERMTLEETMDSLQKLPSAKYSSFELLDSLEQIALNQNKIRKQLKLKLWKAGHYFEKGKYTECKQSCFDILDYERNEDSKIAQTGALVRLGNVYSMTDQAKLAKKSYTEAYELSHQIDDPWTLAYLYRSMGLDFAISKNFVKSLDFLDQEAEILRELKDTNAMRINTHNIAWVYIQQGKPKEAIPYLEPQIEYYQSINDSFELAYCYGTLGNAFLKDNNYPAAIKNYKKADMLASELQLTGILPDVNQALSLAYEKSSNYEKAMHHYERHSKFEREVLNANSEAKIKELESSKEASFKEKEVIIEQEKLANIKLKSRNIYSIGMLLLGIFALGAMLLYSLFVLSKKQKTINEKKEELSQTALNAKLSKSIELQEKVVIKEHEVKEFAKHISNQIDHAQAVIKELEGIENLNTSQIKNKLPDILKFTQSQLSSTKDNVDLPSNIEEINKNFNHRLVSKYSNLTENEIYLASLIRLELSNKEIANLKNISVNSARTVRHRLKKKMGITTTDSLTETLKKI